jgi:hypothetical protein
MTITIENPTAEARLHAYASARGLSVDEAIIVAIEEIEALSEWGDEQEAEEVRAAVAHALAEDPKDSVPLEDYIVQVKQQRMERDRNATA